MKTRFLTLAAALLAVTALSACENTWHGAGRDVEEAGEAMQMQYDGNNY